MSFEQTRTSLNLLVGVFPSINTQDRSELTNDGVLVLRDGLASCG